MFWSHGYDALLSLDDNGDGQLTGPELRGLALRHDRNGNRVSDRGEVKSVHSYGIVSIACRAMSDGPIVSRTRRPASRFATAARARRMT